MNLIKYLLILILIFSVVEAYPQGVKIAETGDKITLINKFVSFTFDKANANLSVIAYKQYSNVLGSKGRGYLLGPGFSMGPSQFKIIRSTDELIEIAFDHQASNHFKYVLHYVLKADVAGVYCFLIQSHQATDAVGSYGQTRWGINADPQLFDYHLVRDSIQGPMPQMADLDPNEKVQDWTFKLPDGTVYTKYDYADYIEGRNVHGMAGQKSGLGMFVIQASHEYLDGGPTKQYQNVHATPFLINMFNCGHFLSDIRKADDQIASDWTKLCGPFLLYINHEKDIKAVWADAKRQAAIEIGQWPYQWMQNPAYPLSRGTVKGTLSLANGTKASKAMVILAAQGYDWQAQTQGYIFNTLADSDGSFDIGNVRPGNYTLYAYGDNQTDEFTKADITVKSGEMTNLGNLKWSPISYGEKLWQIGVADRRTTGFKLADHKRNYGLFNEVPATLDYTVGKSKDADDWYYAQTKAGQWNILFDLQKQYKANATLTLALAGAARWPILEVWVNDTLAGKLDTLGNDASVYRSAIAGGYYQKKEVVFPAGLLKKGQNTIALKLVKVKPGGGIMYDAIKLEAN